MPCTARSAEADKLSEALAGVRHVLRASLSAAENAPYANAKDGKLPADLRANVRISDHSPDADFFGGVVAHFGEVTIGEGTTGEPGAEKIIWQASKCHRERGLPKVSVTGIEGIVGDGDNKVQVAAVARHIGKLMPADEIIITKPLARSFSNLLTELAFRAETKVTRLVLDLRLTAIRCGL